MAVLPACGASDAAGLLLLSAPVLLSVLHRAEKTALLLPAVYLLALAGTLLLGPCVLTRYVYPLMLSVTVLSLLLFGRGRPAEHRSYRG